MRKSRKPFEDTRAVFPKNINNALKKAGYYNKTKKKFPKL